MSERTPTEAPSAPAAAAPERTSTRTLAAGEYGAKDTLAELATAARWYGGTPSMDEWPRNVLKQCADEIERADALAARYEELEQTTAELCEDCGWRMRIPGRGCTNCERYRLRARYEEVIEALRAAPHPDGFDRTAPEFWFRRYYAWQESTDALLARHDESRTTGESEE